ncbi:hypothetical protein MHYP_G00295100 [Metynnis hypsauchen]
MLSRHSDPFCKWTTSHLTESRQVRTGTQSMGTSVYRSLLLSTGGFSVSDQIRKFTDGPLSPSFTQHDASCLLV